MRNLRGIVNEFKEQGKAVAHFNVSNFEQIKGIFLAAADLKAPVIIGLSEGERDYLGTKGIINFIKSFGEEKGVQVFLNADHTHSLEKVEEAAKAGFDAILFDGGKLSFEENIEMMKKAVSIAKEINPDVLMEGELGYIGDSSRVLKDVPEGAAVLEKDVTKPEEAERFVRETGVDLLAPAVGNIHGVILKENSGEFLNPKINIDLIGRIREAAGIPLVLHGGSGIKGEEFEKAIKAGVAVIHVSTELRLAWRREMEKALEKDPEEIAPYKLTRGIVDSIKEIAKEKISLFGK